MIAVVWPWDQSTKDRYRGVARRLAASLCAGIGGHAASAEVNGLEFAFRPLRATEASARAWRPTLLPDGSIAAFHGYFDNPEAIARELGESTADLARLYALAVQRWGDEAERHVIGEYCAIIAEPQSKRLRLSRSPLRAPPLCYFHGEHCAAAASVPRALFAAGVEPRLNETRLADTMLMNFTDTEATWYEDVSRVPLGHVVELQPGKARVLRECYDVMALPDVRMENDSDYIARAKELLDEAVQACLKGFSRPGATLSGGLDSPQVAVRALAALPQGQRLPTFTFHPEEGFDGRVQEGFSADERPFVEAFAKMHPRLEPHFTSNPGYGHDHRWNDFFHLMGGAPSGLCNMYVFHGLFSEAAKQGCDVLLLSEWGNDTFSEVGRWGYVEYFLKGRWRQLWLGLTRFPVKRRSTFRRFLTHSVLPLFPDSVWRLVRRIVFPNDRLLLDLMQPLSPEYRIRSGADMRAKDAGIVFERYQPVSRRHARKLSFQNFEVESDEIYQGFEQMYGVAQRDPTAYRPFVEFCLGLPTRMFLRDGHRRWLAKELGKGIMPEEQRANRLNGRWDSDWHLRIGRRRKEYLAELDRLSRDERFSGMLDFPRLRAALEKWPKETGTDPQAFYSAEFAVPRALLAARFINYVEGRNQ